MNIKDLLQDDALKALEGQIILSFARCFRKSHDHTDFAITDFIYCRDFYYEIKVEFRNEAQQTWIAREIL